MLRSYARTAPFVLCAMTSPPVIFGAFGTRVSSFSSRSQLATIRLDSSARAEVSKKLIELARYRRLDAASPRRIDGSERLGFKATLLRTHSLTS